MDAGQHRSFALLIQAKIARTGHKTHLRPIDMRYMMMMMTLIIHSMLETHCKTHEATITVSVIVNIVIVKANNAKHVLICSC